MTTTVSTEYTSGVGVSISSKSGVTIWNIGAPASETRRYPLGTAAAVGTASGKVKGVRRTTTAKASVKV